MTTAQLLTALMMMVSDGVAFADVAVARPPSLHPFRGPFFPTSTAALRHTACVGAFVDHFGDDFPRKEVAERLVCRRLPLAIDASGTPILEAEVWEGHASFNWDKQVEVLAVRTARGWFVAPFDGFWENRWNAGETTGIRAVAAERVAIAGTRTLALRWQSSMDDWAWDAGKPHNDDHTDDEGRTLTFSRLAVVVVAASGVPEITGAIDVAVTVRSDRDTSAHATVTLDVAFTAAGIELTGPRVEKHLALRKWKDVAAPLRPAHLPFRSALMAGGESRQ